MQTNFFMKKILALVLMMASLAACNNNDKKTDTQFLNEPPRPTSVNNKKHYEGSFSNGMKETSISFDISDDGSKLENLTFSGYWRCNGELEQDILGPEKSFDIVDNKVDGTITEPEDGDATAIRYELHATIDGDNAQGTFRMNINALGCDTYVLNWTAQKK